MDPYKVDAALTKFGMPMGAFSIADLSGLDIGTHVSGIIASVRRCLWLLRGSFAPTRTG